LNPDGIFLSNGPGDPEGVPYLIQAVRNLIGKKPIFGICLGHQIIGLALGGRTYKLKFGHHGGNQPVKDLTTGKVEITSQNHGFAVDMESFTKDPKGRAFGDPADIVLTHVNLNDNTCEGLMHRRLALLGSVPSRGLAGPARRQPPVQAVRGDDGAGAGAGCKRTPHRIRGGPITGPDPGREATAAEVAECPSGLTSGPS
jgi:hypothetical protein